MKKILLYNLLILSLFFLVTIFTLSILNIIFSGQPRYWEIVHKKNSEKLRVNKEKIVQIKRYNKTISFMNVLDKEYKQLGYSGKFKNNKCGSIESGIYELIYQEDKFGFRENVDERYIRSDFVLLGDSFANSNCENKPNDLKSNLLKLTNYSYLNLSKDGTDYAEQFLNFAHYTKNTDLNGIIWFFYEGNDYEQKSSEIKNIKNIKLKNHDDVNYQILLNHDISVLFRIKVWMAELVRGASVLVKFFKNYDNLLDKKDYQKVHSEMREFLNMKNVKERYLVYIPSWQKISLYKLKNLNLYNKHPQVIQLNNLKNNVKEISIQNGFKFIDTESYYFALDDPLNIFHYKLNTHFNPLGYEILSKAIFKNLD